MVRLNLNSYKTKIKRSQAFERLHDSLDFCCKNMILITITGLQTSKTTVLCLLKRKNSRIQKN